MSNSPSRSPAADWLRGFRAGSRPHPATSCGGRSPDRLGITHAPASRPVESGEGADQVFQPRPVPPGSSPGWACRHADISTDAAVGQAAEKRTGPTRSAGPPPARSRKAAVPRPRRSDHSTPNPNPRPVAAERLRRVNHQAFGVDQSVIQRQPIQKRLQRGTRRTPGWTMSTWPRRSCRRRSPNRHRRAPAGWRCRLPAGRRKCVPEGWRNRRKRVLPGCAAIPVDAGNDARGLGIGLVQALGQQGGAQRRFQ